MLSMGVTTETLLRLLSFAPWRETNYLRGNHPIIYLYLIKFISGLNGTQPVL